MEYRTGLDIKKQILALLKQSPQVISEMERKINTSDRVIKRHVAELEYLGIVKVIKYEKSEKTGRPYTVVKLNNLK
ncbi:MAG: hypothetical protein WCX73_05915 [Candidatus Pacearchaeota archaeon]|jgi:predicted ArsR family transcriptional regulator